MHVECQGGRAIPTAQPLHSDHAIMDRVYPETTQGLRDGRCEHPTGFQGLDILKGKTALAVMVLGPGAKVCRVLFGQAYHGVARIRPRKYIAAHSSHSSKHRTFKRSFANEHYCWRPSFPLLLNQGAERLGMSGAGPPRVHAHLSHAHGPDVRSIPWLDEPRTEVV